MLGVAIISIITTFPKIFKLVDAYFNVLTSRCPLKIRFHALSLTPLEPNPKMLLIISESTLGAFQITSNNFVVSSLHSSGVSTNNVSQEIYKLALTLSLFNLSESNGCFISTANLTCFSNSFHLEYLGYLTLATLLKIHQSMAIF